MLMQVVIASVFWDVVSVSGQAILGFCVVLSFLSRLGAWSVSARGVVSFFNPEEGWCNEVGYLSS